VLGKGVGEGIGLKGIRNASSNDPGPDRFLLTLVVNDPGTFL
jgi:hypothetical protein